MHIPKTNVIRIERIEEDIKTVQCPICKTFLVPIPHHVVTMICWKCEKEFRIEHDPAKIISPEVPSIKGDTTRTIVRG